MTHKTTTVQVWVDVDEDVAGLVVYLNLIPGVRTLSSCQGTIGEGGPYPYRAQVLCSWTAEAYERLKQEFDISMVGESGSPTNGTWGYVHPKATAEATVLERTGLDRARCGECLAVVPCSSDASRFPLYCPNCGRRVRGVRVRVRVE